MLLEAMTKQPFAMPHDPPASCTVSISRDGLPVEAAVRMNPRYNMPGGFNGASAKQCNGKDSSIQHTSCLRFLFALPAS